MGRIWDIFPLASAAAQCFDWEVVAAGRCASTHLRQEEDDALKKTKLIVWSLCVSPIAVRGLDRSKGVDWAVVRGMDWAKVRWVDWAVVRGTGWAERRGRSPLDG